MNPKKINQLSHKLVVLSNLMVETLDDIEACSDSSLEFRAKCKELLPFCETMIGDVFQLQQIKSTTYLMDLSNKVDTVIRREFKEIK